MKGFLIRCIAAGIPAALVGLFMLHDLEAWSLKLTGVVRGAVWLSIGKVWLFGIVCGWLWNESGKEPKH